MTHGRGGFRWAFSSYQEVPPEVADKIREQREKELEEENER